MTLNFRPGDKDHTTIVVDGHEVAFIEEAYPEKIIPAAAEELGAAKSYKVVAKSREWKLVDGEFVPVTLVTVFARRGPTVNAQCGT